MNPEQQIHKQLQNLSHVELQYSSTLKSYETLTTLFQTFSNFLKDQQMHMEQQLKNYSTDQGIGLRKIMIQHLKSLYFKMFNQTQILKNISQKINQKHKSMVSCQYFIEPILKGIKKKNQLLSHELNLVKEKIEIIKHKVYNAHFQSQFSSLNNSQQQIQTQSNPSLLSQKSQRRRFLKQIPPFKELIQHTQCDKLKNNILIEPFLKLKQQEIQDLIQMQNKIKQRTFQKIYQLLDNNLGKGLVQLEKIITNKTKINLIQNRSIIIEQNQISTDLKCYENVQDLINQNQRLPYSKFILKNNESFDEEQRKLNGGQNFNHLNIYESSAKNHKSPTFNLFTFQNNFQTPSINQFKTERNEKKSIYNQISQFYSEKKNTILNNSLGEILQNNENINRMNIQ